jgi:hypothetical protein
VLALPQPGRHSIDSPPRHPVPQSVGFETKRQSRIILTQGSKPKPGACDDRPCMGSSRMALPIVNVSVNMTFIECNQPSPRLRISLPECCYLVSSHRIRRGEIRCASCSTPSQTRPWWFQSWKSPWRGGKQPFRILTYSNLAPRSRVRRRSHHGFESGMFGRKSLALISG